MYLVYMRDVKQRERDRDRERDREIVRSAVVPHTHSVVVRCYTTSLCL